MQPKFVEFETNYTVYIKPADSHLYFHTDRIPAIKINQMYPKRCCSQLCLICNSDINYTTKSKEYTKYLVNKEHDIKWVQQCFSNIGETSQQKTQKKVNPRNADTNVVFSTSIFNSLRPNLNKIMNKNIHVLLTNDNLRKLYPKGRILFVNKMKKNLEQLLM